MTDFQAIIPVAVLSTVALAASVLLLVRGAGRRLPGCGPGSGCDAVSSSRWSRVGRVPVALLGAIAYAGMLTCALLVLRGLSDARQVLIGVSVLVAGAAVWFVFIQLAVIRRFCLYCMIAQAAAIGAAAIVLTRVQIDAMTQRAALIGGGAFAAMVLAQVLIRPKLYKLTTPQEAMPQPVQMPPEPPPAPPPPPPAPAAPLAPPPPPAAPTRRVNLLGGRLGFDASIFPLLGPPDAPHIMAELMDYTCEHCRATFPMLERALRSFNNDVAVLIAYAPLERSCNPHVQIVNPRYAQACHYARLALALWQTAPSEFPTFHHWLLDGPDPPPLELARIRAAELAGKAALDEALAGTKVRDHLADGVTIFRLTGAGMLPKLLLPTGVLSGQVSSEEALISLLRQQLITAAGQVAQPPTRAPAVFSARPIE